MTWKDTKYFESYFRQEPTQNLISLFHLYHLNFQRCNYLTNKFTVNINPSNKNSHLCGSANDENTQVHGQMTQAQASPLHPNDQSDSSSTQWMVQLCHLQRLHYETQALLYNENQLLGYRIDHPQSLVWLLSNARTYS